MFGFRRSKHEVVERYQRFDWASLGRQPVSHTRFVVFDCETTGLDTARDDILSLSAVVVQNGVLSVVEHLDLVFQRGATGAAASVKVHGILPRDLEGGKDEWSAALSFLDFARGAVLVGHHVGFDVSMVERLTTVLFSLRLKNPFVDTAALFRRLDVGRAPPEAAQASLDEVVAALDIPSAPRHSASGDAFSTACAFMVMMRQWDPSRRRSVADLTKTRT